MSLLFRIYSPTGVALGDLPHYVQAGPQQEHNQIGMLTLDYPRNGRNAHLLDADDGFLVPVENGTVRDDWYLLEEDADDPASGREGRLLTVGARGSLALLERALVWTSPDGHTERPMGESTPGAIANLLLNAAVARGVALNGMTWTFTNTHDSAGQPWPTGYDPTYDASLTMLAVILAMADNGWVDVRMKKRELCLYVPNTVCAVDRPGVILRVGKEVTSGPRKRSRRDIRSHMLGVGGESVNVTVSDASTAAKYGRREGAFSQGNTTNEETLAISTEASLDQVKDVAEGFTVVFPPEPGRGVDPISPYSDFGLGDFVRYDQRRLSPTELEPLRVRSIAQVYRQGRLQQTSVELNDLFTEASVRLKRKVDGIINGSLGTPSGPPPTGAASELPPSKPTGLEVTDWIHYGALRWRYAAANLTWEPPTTNTDGSPLTDLRGYDLFYALDNPALLEPAWRQAGVETALNRAYVAPLITGKTYLFKVRATDSDNTEGPFSDTITWTVPAPSQAPPVPSTPTASSRLGTVEITWDGLDVNGGPMPAWFDYAEVHLADADGVPPTDASLIDRLYGPGSVVITGLPYNVTKWVRLRSVSTGEPPAKSAASATVSVVVKPLVDTDVIGKVLDGSKFIDGTVTTSALASGAVSAQKLAQDAIDLIDAAQEAADEAVSVSSSKNTIFVQDTPTPTATRIGDLWIDTGNGNIIKTWSGSAWVTNQDVGIGTAQATANTALTSANGKSKVVWSTNAASGTTGYAAGDTWFRTDGSGVVIAQWEFTTSWQPRTLGSLVIAAIDAGKITSGTIDAARIAANSLSIGQVNGLSSSLSSKTTTFAQDGPPVSSAVGDLWVDTNDNNKLYRAAQVGTSSIGPTGWVAVAPTILTTVTFAQPTIPVSANPGDLWVDTDDNNKMYRAYAAGVSTIGATGWVAVEPTIVVTKTFAQPSTPTSTSIGDLWIDTDDNNKMYRAAAAGATTVAAGQWVAVAPTIVNTTTFAQPGIPTSTTVGDLWIDTDDANRMYRAAAVGATTIAAGQWVAVSAVTSTTFAQDAPPTALNAGDLWIDTNDGNKTYRAFAAGVTAVGATGWVALPPATTRTFAQPGIPTSVTIGDIWIDTDDGNRMYRAESVGATTVAAGAWVAVAPVIVTTRTFAQSAIPTSSNIGDLWVRTDASNTLYRAAAAGVSTTGAGAWEPVATPTVRTFAQAAAPTSINVGDLWVDTDDGNKMYRSAVAGSSAIGAGGWVNVAQPVVNTTTFAQPAAPVSTTVGDIWIDTDDGNKMYRAAVAGTATIGAGGWVAVPPSNTTTFAQPSIPTSTTIGDLWIDTDDANKMYRAAAVGATTIAAGGWVLVEPPKTTTFAQPGIPTSVTIGDLWIDTDDSNKMYRAAAAGATTIAAGGWVAVPPVTTRTFAQDAAPTSVNAGDLWIDTNDGNKMYRAFAAGVSTVGAAGWVAVPPVTTTTFAQADVPTSKTAGDIWVDTDDDNKTYRAAVAGATTVAAGQWVLIERTVARTFAQAAIPTATNAGDIWIDTDDSNKTYRAFAAGVTTIGAAGWVLVDNTAFAAATTLVEGWKFTGQTTIDGGKIQTDTITAVQIAADTITAAQIAAGAIGTGQLAAQSITANKIAAGAVETTHLSVSALGDNVIVNGSFEDTASGESVFPGWTVNLQSTGAPIEWSTDTVNPLVGERSAKGVVAANGGGMLLSKPVPVIEGERFSVRASFRVSTANTGSISARIIFANDPNSATFHFSGAGTAFAMVLADTTPTDTAWATTVASVTVPPGYKYARMQLADWVHPTAHTVWFDSAIARRSVGTTEISPGSVTADIIAAGAVGADEIAANAVVAGKIAANAVTAGTIAALAVEAGKIAANAVTADTIAAGAITAEKIALGVIRSNMVNDSSLEEPYDLTIWDPFGDWAGMGWTQGNVDQWRRSNAPNGGEVRKDLTGQYARSGRGAVLIRAAAGTEAAALSNTVGVEVGKTYRLAVYAASWGAEATMVVTVTGGTTKFNVAGFHHQTLTGDTNWTSPPLTPSGPIDADGFQAYSYTFTADQPWVAVRIINWLPSATSTLVVDDVSLVEVGVGGASEVTAAGLRLFDSDGFESGAFVNNRPNYFSVTKHGDLLASINEDGGITATSLNVPALEMSGNDVVKGLTIYGTEFTKWLDNLPRGVIAHAWRTTSSTVRADQSAAQPYLRIDTQVKANRLYRIYTNDMLIDNDLANGRSTAQIRFSDDGAAATIWSPIRRFSRLVQPVANLHGNVMLSRFYSPSTDRQLSALITYMGETGGCYLYATGDEPIELTIEDVGPSRGNAGINVNGTVPPVVTRWYSSTWWADGSRNFNGNGTQKAPTDYDVIHGPWPGGGGDNRYGIITFGGGAQDGETGATVAQAIGGAGVTIHNVWVYLYANHWYWNSGGTATIRAWGSPTLPSTGSYSGGTVTSGGWPKPGGRWVDIKSIFGTGGRGVVVGATGTSDLTTYGRFNGAGQANGPMLRIEYTKTI